MAAERGLFRQIKLILDKVAAKKMEADAQESLKRSTDPKGVKKNLSQMDSALGLLKKGILALGAAFAAAFAARKIVNFVKSTIKAFADQEVIWNRLEGVLATVGVRFGDVETRIRTLAEGMQQVTTFGDEDFAQTLTTLVGITGDFEGSLRNVGLAMNLSLLPNIRNLETASLLVGRAMIGDTALLKRYGIVVKEGGDAIDAMRKKSEGLAEQAAKTLSGRLDQLRQRWDDLKQSIGRVLVGGNQASQTLISMRDAVKELTDYIDANRDMLSKWAVDAVKAVTDVGRAIVWLITRLQTASDRLETFRDRFQIAFGGALAFVTRGAVGLGMVDEALKRINDRMREALRLDEKIHGLANPPAAPAATPPPAAAVKAEQEQKDLLAEEIKLLKQGHDLHQLTADEIARAFAIEKQVTEALKAGNLTLQQRIALAEKLSDISAVTGPIRTAATPRTQTTLPAPGPRTVRQLSGSDAQFMAERTKAAERAVQEAQRQSDLMLRIAYDATDGIGEAFDNLFTGLVTGFDTAGREMKTLGDFAASLGGSIAAGLARGMAELMEGKAAWALADAFFPVFNPGALWAAAKYSIAAGLFRAVEGLARGGGHGGGTASGVTSTNVGANQATAQQNGQPETHIYINWFDKHNPVHQEIVANAVDAAKERGSKIVYHDQTRTTSTVQGTTLTGGRTAKRA